MNFSAAIVKPGEFQQTLRDPLAQAAMRRFLELGGQTRDPELRMGDLVTEL